MARKTSTPRHAVMSTTAQLHATIAAMPTKVHEALLLALRMSALTAELNTFEQGSNADDVLAVREHANTLASSVWCYTERVATTTVGSFLDQGRL